MTLIVRNLEKRFGERLLFSHVNFTVGPGRKVALIGPNGSGKTTLLNILGGTEEYDKGVIETPIRNFHLGMLNQFYSVSDELKLLDDALSAGVEISNISVKMEQIIEHLNSESDSKAIEKLSADYADLEERFLFLGGYNYEGEVQKTLKGLGFLEEDFDKRVKDLSGGERTRLVLGKLLISKPNLMLLDEPTNHLDIESVEWLESFIREYTGACLMVSHDRYFLDNTTQVILELDDGAISSYTGNYRDYLRLKCEKIEREWKEYKRQKEEIVRLKKFINRWKADKRRSRQAKSREKTLQRITPMKRPRSGQKAFSIHIDSGDQSFTKVLEVNNAGKSYVGKQLFRDLEFTILKGEKFAITGRNGQGKSTLLRCLMNRDTLDSGTYRWGGNTEIGYFAQDRIELDENDNFLQAFQRHFPDWKIDECKQFLGGFYINLDDLAKPVSNLSGGEKSKLALSILIAKKPNVLILDEPTNHLDIIASEALEMSLENYTGTLILVSHDRRMLDRLADRTLYMKNGEGKIYPGNYAYMREKQTEEMAKSASVEIDKSSGKLGKTDKKKHARSKKVNVYKVNRIEELYDRLEIIEKEIENLHFEMSKPDVSKDWKKVADFKKEVDNLNLEADDIHNEIEKRESELYSGD